MSRQIAHFSFVYQVGRKYFTGTRIVTIVKKVVDAMLLWTTNPHIADKTIDEKVIRLLMICCVPENELKRGQIEEDVMLFIEGK